jgi:hypothetical protein
MPSVMPLPPLNSCAVAVAICVGVMPAGQIRPSVEAAAVSSPPSALTKPACAVVWAAAAVA